jgi:hypothetical protein
MRLEKPGNQFLLGIDMSLSLSAKITYAFPSYARGISHRCLILVEITNYRSPLLP